MESDALRWRLAPILWAALAAFLAGDILSTVIGGLLGFPAHAVDFTPLQLAISTTVRDVTIIVMLPSLLWRWADVGSEELALHRIIGIRAGVITGLGAWVVVTAVNILETRVIGPHPQAVTLIEFAHPSPLSVVLELIVGSGLVPIAEELLFRAVLFVGLRQRMGFWPAAAISSALFGLAHGLTLFIPITISGLLFAGLYERRHSLGTNVLAHGTLNAISTILVYVGASAGVVR